MKKSQLVDPSGKEVVKEVSADKRAEDIMNSVMIGINNHLNNAMNSFFAQTTLLLQKGVNEVISIYKKQNEEKK